MAVLLIFGIQMACQLTFNAIERTCIYHCCSNGIILLIPLIYILPSLFPQNPTFSVYLAEPVADFFAVCFTAILFMFQFKKALQQISDIPPEQPFSDVLAKSIMVSRRILINRHEKALDFSEN